MLLNVYLVKERLVGFQKMSPKMLAYMVMLAI